MGVPALGVPALGVSTLGGLGFGFDMMGIAKYMISSFFFRMSAPVNTGSTFLGRSDCLAIWSSNHFWIVATFSTMECLSFSSMCEYFSSADVACDR